MVIVQPKGFLVRYIKVGGASHRIWHVQVVGQHPLVE